MKVRAKFRCTSIEQFDTTGETRKVRLSAVYPGNDASEEDKAFWKYTPFGSIEMQIDNPPASEMFIPGNTYYVDFTPTDEV